MKKDSILIIVLAVIAVLLASFTAYILITGTGKKSGKDNGTKKPASTTEDQDEDETVTDYEKITIELRRSPRGGTTKLVIFNKGGGETSVSVYHMNGSADQTDEYDTKIFQTKRILEMLNEYDFISWNGFEGKRPKGTKDGDSFEITGTVNGKDFYAKGDENFPDGFMQLFNRLSISTSIIEF